MNYCTQCGAKVELRIPEGDTHLRHVCRQCGEIHYLNPKLVIGCIAEWNGNILLCRRAIEPRHGFWTLPAGFMENNESTPEGACRETLEEAGARISLEGMFSYVDIPRISQIHIIYRARLLDLNFAAGEESLEVKLVDESEIPWEHIAFHSIEFTLRRFLEDRKRGHFGLHTTRLEPRSYS